MDSWSEIGAGGGYHTPPPPQKKTQQDQSCPANQSPAIRFFQLSRGICWNCVIGYGSIVRYFLPEGDATTPPKQKLNSIRLQLSNNPFPSVTGCGFRILGPGFGQDGPADKPTAQQNDSRFGQLGLILKSVFISTLRHHSCFVIGYGIRIQNLAREGEPGNNSQPHLTLYPNTHI